MPEVQHFFELNDQEKEVLEQVREAKGLNSLDEAARYLIKSRLRKAAMKATGRNRAIYLVGKDPQ